MTWVEEPTVVDWNSNCQLCGSSQVTVCAKKGDGSPIEELSETTVNKGQRENVT